jgi:hypothetical protein
MADRSDSDAASRYWGAFVEGADSSFAEAIQRNVEAQAEFADAWRRAIEGDGQPADAMAGYLRAYETWMEATRRLFDRFGDSMAGEEVPIEEFRDIWLDAANDAFKDVMGTEAFAAATGQTVEDVLDVARQNEELSETTWHNVGLASRRDIIEVGDRLVELERRQQAVEEKLDRVIEQVEE